MATFKSHACASSATEQRKRDLARIHMARAALGWSEDDYRFHLRQITGADSAADLDAAGRRRLLEHMAACGWKPRSAFKPFGQPEKIRWLWSKLGQAGAVRDAGTPALLAFVARTTGMGVDDVRFLPTAQASIVIEALKSWLDRAQRTHA